MLKTNYKKEEKAKTHPHRVRINPVGANEDRPLWSVMVPTYNCSHYLKKTLSSILLQDPGEKLMHIEVVDDCSTLDNPAEVVAEIGNSRVKFYRQPANVGVPKNFDTCLERSRGQLVHILHGDDFVLDGFYDKMQIAFAKNSYLGAAFCRQVFVDENDTPQNLSDVEQKTSGILENYLERLASEQRIMTPSIVVKREVYEQLGGFDRRLICSEDWEMWVRIAAKYPVWYEPEALAAYRMHANSNTGRHIRSGEDMWYTRKAISIFKNYLPQSISERVSKKAREVYALSALLMAEKLLDKKDFLAAYVQVKEAISFSVSPGVIKRSLKVARKALSKI